MAKKKAKQPCVTHVTADGRLLTDVKEYEADFYRLPEAAQRLLVQLTLGPVCSDPLEKSAAQKSL